LKVYHASISQDFSKLWLVAGIFSEEMDMHSTLEEHSKPLELYYLSFQTKELKRNSEELRNLSHFSETMHFSLEYLEAAQKQLESEWNSVKETLTSLTEKLSKKLSILGGSFLASPFFGW